MSEPKRLKSRNEQIAAMLADSEQLKHFYRFIAQNPHINLHDACQIVIERPNATVCFSFNEWAAMDRRVIKGRKGIAYYDRDGYKQFVFDATDTHGDNRYSRPILPMKRLLIGLDELNETDDAESEHSDYYKIEAGVKEYLTVNGELTGDDKRDEMLIQGIAYSLYSKTGFPRNAGIYISGLPYSYTENAAFVKDVYVRTDMLVQDIEEAYSDAQRRAEEINVVNDIDDESVSDEPDDQSATETGNTIVKIDKYHGTFFLDYSVIIQDIHVGDRIIGANVFIGKTKNIDEDKGTYDNSDDSLVYVSDNVEFERLFWEDGFYATQQELIKNGTYTSEDYRKYAELQSGLLKDARHDGEILFGVNDDDPDSGVPFRYPDWHDEYSVGQTEKAVEEQPITVEPEHPVSPMYKRYMDAQKLDPTAIVLMRLGDFYEIFGDGAKTVSQELDLTLTGREMGLPERVPMCGLPYHAMELYLDKILENHGAIILEPDEEPKYIKSHAEALEQNAESEEEKTAPAITETIDVALIQSDDEQSNTEDWRAELAAELEESDGQPDEPEKHDEPDESDEQVEQTEHPKDKAKSTPKKEEKGIKDRKRKVKPQVSVFDLLEQSEEEQMIERQLKEGSGFEHGKFRILDKYHENPTAKTFAEFLKKEYGIGSSSHAKGEYCSHDGKGLQLTTRDEQGNVTLQVLLKWPEVATRIADLIDDDKYFTARESKEYVEYKVEQNRQQAIRQKEKEERAAYLAMVFTSAPDERKERIVALYNESENTNKFTDAVRALHGYNTVDSTDEYRVLYNPVGVFVSQYDEHGNRASGYTVSWEETGEIMSALIKDNKYLAPKPQEEEHIFNRFKQLTEKGKKVFDAYQNGYMREPTYSMWDEVQSCRTIANGIYDVSTPGHGGIMIDAELAPHILSPEALNKGVQDRGYYCYEEDCDACIPLRELWDKGILNETSEYFTHFYVNSNSPEAVNGCVPFNAATEAEKTEYFKMWNNAVDESLENWNEKYWQAHEQVELSPEQQKIKDIVGRIVKEGTENTSSGNWVVYFDEFGDDERFVREHQDEIADMLGSREEVAEIDIDGDAFDTTYYLDFCPNYEDTWHEFDDGEENGNTDLNGVLDQNELGGAKTRFKGNVAAIKLVNKLYAENRNPTDAEKKVLSQFVGWGGLSQAFDENNTQWSKEYAELKGLLSQEDYEQAKSSTLNAYYTAKDVIDGIYAALDRFGVKGNNRVLEPSMGTGNFFGFMPKEIADGSRLYGVELDNLTGRIAAKLYPQANVQIKGFEDTSFPDDKFDVVVGNVPFGGYGVADSAYNRYNFKVHDYFLAKSVDKVKPGGIVAIVTSKGTMDKLNPSARKYVAERAELLGAIRLPNTAFKQTAGTEAVADILFFRKRTEKINADTENIEWLGTGKTDEGYEINNYFINHPEMVLGTLAEETGLYGGKDVTVKPDGRALSEAIKEAVKNLPQGFYTVPEKAPRADEKEVDYNVKPMCYKADGGRLYMRVGDEMVEQRIPSYPKDAYQRIQSMIALREELHRILDVQIKGCSDAVLEEEQKKLNAMYDTFIGKYGEINSQTNVRLFKDDGDSALLFACEDIDKETKKVSKAEIFYKRTIRPYIVPTSTDDPFEALQISKNERGRVDIAYIEELTGKDYDTVLFELGDAVFRNPETTDRSDKYSGFETSEEYLSGRVVEKLNTAKRYAEQYPEFSRNVSALEQVQPTKLTATDISVRLGATWVDKEYYKEFYCELVGVYWWQRSGVELFYNPFDSSWRLDQKDSIRYDTQMKQKEVYGTKRAPAYRLFIDAMNMRPTTIYDTVVDSDGTERRVLNQPETIAAREKQNQIKELFANWIYSKPERREELEATYNRLFNQIKLPSYDGSYLKFPEMNPAIELKPHQKNAVHRIISGHDSTLLHHVVGSGKTYTMIASIMKMRQLGVCKKAVVAVPNHLVQQWAGEWRKLYPNAKILVATKEDLEKDNRQRFVSKVAMGDWDGIIIAQSSFAKIPISQERQIKKLQQEIKLIEATVKKQWEEKGMPRGAVKNLERIKKSREAMLKKLMDGNKKDDVLTFENLGVDYLYVDEAHYYKNLYLFTKMNNVAGVSNAASQRASDLKLKCEYLQELHKSDRGVVFGTGTPISNSMSEMYTMQSYLQPTALVENGTTFFDGWAADFGETITSMELAPSGQGYRARTRFAKFTNLPELLTMYRSFADVQTSDMVKLDVPEAEKHVVNLKPSDAVITLAEQIAERAELIHDGLVSPYVDNMLKITSDGKKLALDPRCFVPESEDEAGSKINVAAENIHEIWERTLEFKGTQIVFCDLSTPKKKFEDYIYGTDFDAYNDLKYKLVESGIPADEIAYIHEANTDEQKQALFDKVNSGAIRILIGSTEKCGAGTNVQKRLVALHHLDTPYRPSDMEQREGRIIRQGNENKKVDIYTYVTERTFDSYSYQILENKQRFIGQINKGDLTVRVADDIDETTWSYAQIKAITAANPKIQRKMEVDAEISRLRVLEGQYKKQLFELQDKIRKDFPEEIRKQELLLERVMLDLAQINSSKPDTPDAFEISVNGTVYTDRKEGGKALTEALFGSKPEKAVAEYCGFKISMNPITSFTDGRDVTLAANGQYTMGISDSASGNLTRLDNFIEDFPKRKERLENKLKQLKDDLAIAQEQVQKPFEQKSELLKLLNEQAELDAELNLDKKDDVIVGDDGEDDGNYRALPTQRKVQEDDIIDKEDKVAMMQSDVLPDYSVYTEDMHDYGYTWDGMLPMRKSAAQRAFNSGIQVYRLGTDDTETAVEYGGDFEDGVLYGVEKPVWNEYLESDNGRAYMAARLQFAEAAKMVTSEELDYVDERFTIGFIEANFAEHAALSKYLVDKPADTEAMKSYVPRLLEEYTGRIWSDALEYYGWDKDSLRRSIADNIENAELKAIAQDITSIAFNAEKELNAILGGKTKQEIDDMNLPAFSDGLTVVAKEPAYLLNVGNGIKQYAEGLLLLENNVTGDWYVINDTFAKNESGKSLAVGDTTDVMTVLAYNGLYDGNPLREFKDEAQARKFYDEKVNAIHSVRLSAAKNSPLVVGNGTEQERILAVIEDYCDGSERIYGGTEDRIGLALLAENAACSADKVKELMEKYGARIDGDTVLLNDTVQFERRLISSRPNFDDFIRQIRSTYFASQNQVDYESEVIESVKTEYDAFQAEMLNSTPKKVFNNNYKIHLYNEFSEVIQCGTDYLSDNDFKALYEERGHILFGLYDDYIGQENYSVETYGDTAHFIKDYCEKTHNNIYYPTTYYGKDTENRAYYRFARGIATDNIVQLEESDADMYTIAAPSCFLSQEELERNRIFYLNIGRDIQADELNGGDAMRNMMNAMDNYKRIYPLYLQTAKYANEHYEMIDHRNSRKSNMECRLAIEKAIRDNFDGMHLNDNFEDKLIEQYGMERVAFVVATTINEHNYDGRYSHANKEWAKTIPMSEDANVRSECCLTTHPAVLDGFADRIKARQIVLYTTIAEQNASGQPCYNAYSLNRESGEIAYLDGDFGSDLALQATVDQNAYEGHTGYTFKRIEPQELYAMSEQIKAKNKNKEKKMAQDKYKNFTPQGYKVLSIVKDRDDRNIAILQRKDDFVVAPRYDTTDGTWAQGFYDIPTLEAAEKFRQEKYGFENTANTEKRKWLTFKVSPEALIKKYERNSRFRMPKGSSYEGCSYSVFNDRIKESTMLVDLESDGRERALEIRIPEESKVELYESGEKIMSVPAFEFVQMVDGTASNQYEREARLNIRLPREAIIKEYDTSVLVATPTDSEYKGYVYYLPSSVVKEDTESDDGSLVANVGDNFKITLRKGEERLELTAKEFADNTAGKTDYKREPTAMDEYREQSGDEDKSWSTVAVSENAVIANYENSTLFKMPKGDYAGFVYYIPSGMVRKDENGLSLRIPEDFVAHLKDGDDKTDLAAQEFIAAITGKTDDDYESVYRAPSEEAKAQFAKMESQLRKNVPEEMLKKPNWVVVRTRENKDTGRLDKFLVNPHTGKFAESDNPETWADFDTACEYARENGGVCLAYALDGKDGIACIDLDGCMQENGDFSETAQQAFNAASGSYAEKSVSGKGLHIFGKTKGADLRSFSKDKTMEYYQGGHFIAMTGDYYGSSELKSFDTPEMQTVLESKLEKRTEWKHTGEGVEGLSCMDDRELLDKAFSATNGNTVRRLYNGEDLHNNHSSSDMALMNYLAFWSRHDIDQMLRVFATSGLFRANKKPSYYEHTAITAVKGTPCYTPPKASGNNKPSDNGSGNGKGGK